LNALENPDLTLILKALIEESAAPLEALETDFAADSSGFSTSTYGRWFNVKYGREMTYVRWLKAHVMVGTRTNVVTSVEVTDAFTHDSKLFKPLLSASAKRFNMKRVSADKAYSSKEIVQAIDAAGAVPLIPFKSNARVDPAPPNRKIPALWKKMYHYFMYNREEFLQHYHKRSNVETTFHMIKSKFGTAFAQNRCRAG
jgi:transposase